MHEPEETQPLVLTRKGWGLGEFEGDRASLRALQTQDPKELWGKPPTLPEWTSSARSR
jgi:hypothetical protein